VVSASGGRTVYVSGQVSANAKGEVVGKGDIKAQTTQVFENLKIALAAAGAGPKDVVKTNIYVVNFKAEDIPAIRDIRNAFFANVEPPASTLVGVTALANPDWLIEIEVIAVVA
jgi:enamine deaminase RidA (YjgF/YER057c/UK114 family)